MAAAALSSRKAAPSPMATNLRNAAATVANADTHIKAIEAAIPLIEESLDKAKGYHTPTAATAVNIITWLLERAKECFVAAEEAVASATAELDEAKKLSSATPPDAKAVAQAIADAIEFTKDSDNQQQMVFEMRQFATQLASEAEPTSAKEKFHAFRKEHSGWFVIAAVILILLCVGLYTLGRSTSPAGKYNDLKEQYDQLSAVERIYAGKMPDMVLKTDFDRKVQELAGETRLRISAETALEALKKQSVVVPPSAPTTSVTNPPVIAPDSASAPAPQPAAASEPAPAPAAPKYKSASTGGSKASRNGAVRYYPGRMIDAETFAGIRNATIKYVPLQGGLFRTPDDVYIWPYQVKAYAASIGKTPPASGKNTNNPSDTTRINWDNGPQ